MNETPALQELFARFEQITRQISLNHQVSDTQPISQEELLILVDGQKKAMQDATTVLSRDLQSGFERALVVYTGSSITSLFDPRNEWQLFKPGSEVMLKKDSPFFQEALQDLKGTIKSLDVEGNEGWISVDFGSQVRACRYGKPNIYNGFSDVVLLSPIKPTTLCEKTVTVNSNGQIMEISNQLGFDLHVGDTVLLHPMSRVVVAHLNNLSPTGVYGLVNNVLDDRLDVSIEGSSHFVYANPEWKSVCNRGDQVLVDSSRFFAIEIVNKKARSVSGESVGKIGMDQVIGLEEAKEEIRDHIREVAYPELYASAIEGTIHSNVNAKGMLLVGPPGNGKTLLVKAAAKDHNLIILTLPSTEALQKYVGDGPALIRSYRSEAEKLFKETGKPVVVFVDEIDAIARKRSSDGNNEHLNSLTNALLTTMDGTEVADGILWIGATNREELLDPAITRAGRLSRKVFVGRPKENEIRSFFELYFQGVKTKEVELSELVDFATANFLSDDNVIYELFYIKEGVKVEKPEDVNDNVLDKVLFKLVHVGSGAMFANIAGMAMRKALRRDVAGNRKVFSGITKEDVAWSISETYQGVLSINIDDAIAEFLLNEKRTPYREVSHRKK